MAIILHVYSMSLASSRMFNSPNHPFHPFACSLMQANLGTLAYHIFIPPIYFSSSCFTPTSTSTAVFFFLLGTPIFVSLACKLSLEQDSTSNCYCAFQYFKIIFIFPLSISISICLFH